MAIPPPKKEARGRKAAESTEKMFGQEFKPMKFPVDMQRELNTKRSILNLRKKTQEIIKEDITFKIPGKLN